MPIAVSFGSVVNCSNWIYESKLASKHASMICSEINTALRVQELPMTRG